MSWGNTFCNLWVINLKEKRLLTSCWITLLCHLQATPLTRTAIKSIFSPFLEIKLQCSRKIRSETAFGNAEMVPSKFAEMNHPTYICCGVAILTAAPQFVCCRSGLQIKIMRTWQKKASTERYNNEPCIQVAQSWRTSSTQPSAVAALAYTVGRWLLSQLVVPDSPGASCLAYAPNRILKKSTSALVFRIIFKSSI